MLERVHPAAELYFARSQEHEHGGEMDDLPLGMRWLQRLLHQLEKRPVALGSRESGAL